MRCIDDMNRYIACPALSGLEWWAWVLIVLAVFGVLGFIWEVFIGPRWNVWRAHMEGLAELQQSKNEQQIQVTEAQGRLDAAHLNRKAAVIEAEAVAQQIQTIGNQLTSHDLYLKWQWIKMMEDRDGSTIYVPTEAGLPILEAGKR